MKTPKSIYSFTVKTVDGTKKRLSDFKGSVLLLVNVTPEATSEPQYKSLEKLHKRYRPKGFEAFAFPADSAHALCGWLRHRADGLGDEIQWDRELSRDFNKFLINDSGLFLTWYGPEVDPLSPQVIETIKNHLPEPSVGCYPGYVVWLESKTGRRFPTYVFRADTDMATDGLECLTSTAGNEIVLTNYNVKEYRLGLSGHAGYLKACQMLEKRTNRMLGREDLRVVWSDAASARHRDIFAEKQWAQKIGRQEASVFTKRGGKITAL